MDSYFGQKQWIKTPWWICFLQSHSLLHYNMSINGLETCGFLVLLWCFYQLFGLSFWWHPFTAEDSLLIKWTNATFSMKKQTHLHLSLSVSTFPANAIFGWTIHIMTNLKRFVIIWMGHGMMVGPKPPAQCMLIKSPPTGLQWLQFQQIGEAL